MFSALVLQEPCPQGPRIADFFECLFQRESQSTSRSGRPFRRGGRLHKQGGIMVFFPFFIPEGPGGFKYIKNPTHPRTPNALPLSRRPDFDLYRDDV